MARDRAELSAGSTGSGLGHFEAPPGSPPEMERLLAEQRAFFLALLENTFDGVAVLGPDGNVAWVVPRGARFLGFPPEELVGHSAVELIHPDDLAAGLGALGQVLAEPGARAEVEARFRHQDGSWRPLQVCAVNRVDDPAVRGIVVSHRDLSERASAQQAIAERERFFSAVLENAFEVVVVTDAEAVLRYVAPTMTRSFGWTPEDLLGNSGLEVVHPDDRLEAANQLAHILESPGRAVVVPALRVLHKNGDVRLMQARAVNLLDDPAVRGIVTVFEDTTERVRTERELARTELAARAKEAQLAQITAAVPGVVFQYCLAADGSESVPFVSTGAREVFGVDPAEIERDPALAWSLTLPDDLNGLQQQIAASWREVAPLAHEWRVRTRRGEIRWISGRATPVRAADGSTTWTGLMVDVTERKQLEERLDHIQKMESLGRLAGGVAHDFNNLLTGILGHIDLAGRRTADPAEVTRHLMAVREAASRGASLTRQLLAVARRQVMTPRMIDLNRLIAGVEELLRRVVGEEIELDTWLDPRIGTVRVDPGQIEQVLLNLAVNARDAMPHGGKLVMATRNCKAEGEPWVELLVKDSGIGMTDSVRIRAFEPFFTTKRPGEGTGLGLATCYAIVEQSGGRITIESEAGAGTAIRVLLPRQASIAEELPVTLPESDVGGGTETLLVAEDEPLVRAVVVTTLRSFGYTVLEASNGENALDVARAHHGKIDLLVTDVVMPRLGGFDLARRIHDERADLPVLFMSGHAERALAHHGEISSSGELAGEFLAKPFSSAELGKRVRAILDR